MANLRVGSKSPVFVTHTEFSDTNCLAFCQVGDIASQADTVAERVAEVCENSDASALGNVAPGSLCLALFNEDNSWYRARIVRVSGELLTVYFIDYGNTEQVSIDNVLEAPDYVLAIPALSTRCIVSDCTPLDQTWSAEEKRKIETMLVNGEFTCEVTSIDSSDLNNPIYTVKLYNADTPDTPIFVRPASKVDQSLLRLQSLKVGQTYQVYVSHVESSQLFWVQLVSTEDELNTLMADLAACFAEDLPSTGDLVGVKNDQVCAACFTEDGAFYRGVVQNLKGSTCTVLYIDYGNHETKSTSELFSLPQALCKSPKLAIQCKYKDGGDPNSLEKLINDPSLAEQVSELTVLSSTSNGYVVEIDSIEKILGPSKKPAGHSYANNDQARSAKPSGSYLPTVLMVDSTYDICLSHVDSPSNFYVQMLGKASDLDNLMQAIDQVAHNAEKLTDPVPGIACVAQFSDGAWYRSEVVSSQGGSCEVVAVDFGFKESVGHSKIRTIDDRFCQLNAQCVQCSIDLSKNNSSWAPEQVQRFKALMEKSALVARVSAKKGQLFQLELFDTNSGIDRNLNEEFLKIKSQTSPQTRQQSSYQQSRTMDVKKTLLPPPEVTPGSRTTLCITALKMPVIYGQLTHTPVEKVAKLQTDLNNFFENHSCETLQSPSIGAVCCTKYVDGGWYRGIVTSIQGSKVEVAFADFGDGVMKSLEDVKVLPENLCDLPQQCIQCMIDNLPTAPTGKLEMVLVNSRIEVLVKKKEEGPFPTYAVDITSRQILDKLHDRPASTGFKGSSGPSGFRSSASDGGSGQRGFNRSSPPSTRDGFQQSGSGSRGFGGGGGKPQREERAGSSSRHVSGNSAFVEQNVEMMCSQEVMVTYVKDPGNFQVVLEKMTESLDEVMDKLHTYYSKLPPDGDCLENPKLGEACVAQFSEDNDWYRAVISGLRARGQAEVKFVDYGNNDYTEVENLKVIKPEYMSLPAQAIQCSLADVAPTQGFWTPEQTLKFEEMVVEQSFTAKFRSKENEQGEVVYKLELVDKSGQNVNKMFGELTNTTCRDGGGGTRSFSSTGMGGDMKITVSSGDSGLDEYGGSSSGFGKTRSFSGGSGGGSQRSSGFGGGGGRSGGFGSSSGPESGGFGGSQRSGGFGGSGGRSGGFGSGSESGDGGGGFGDSRKSGFGGGSRYGGGVSRSGGSFGKSDDGGGFGSKSSGDSGFGGRGFGGGGGGGSKDCFKCGESGHFSRECPNAASKGGGGGSRDCFRCGESGHISRDCPNQPRGGGGSRDCFKCGEAGHMARDCPNPQKAGGGRDCYKCGQPGHIARECPNPDSQGGQRRGGGSGFGSQKDNASDNWGSGGSDRGFSNRGGGGGFGSRGSGGFGSQKEDGNEDWGSGGSESASRGGGGFGNRGGGSGFGSKSESGGFGARGGGGFGSKQESSGFGSRGGGGFGQKSGDDWGSGGTETGGRGGSSGGMGSRGGGFGGKENSGGFGQKSSENDWGSSDGGGDRFGSKASGGFGGNRSGGSFKGNAAASEDDWGSEAVAPAESSGYTQQSLSQSRSRGGDAGSASTEQLTPLTMKVGQSMDVYVVFTTSPEEFWCQMIENCPSLEELMGEMNSFYGKLSDDEMQLSNAMKGMYCAAKFSDDNMWYRAEILTTGTNQVDVLFVDYGNSDTIPVQKLKMLKPEFMKLKKQGLKCGLDSVVATNNSWSETAGEDFEDLTMEKHLLAKVTSAGPDQKYVIDLQNVDEKVNIGEALCEKGHCSFSTIGMSPKKEEIIVSPYPPVDVAIGQELDVYVSWIETPEQFWIQPVSQENQLMELVDKIQEMYGEGSESKSVTSVVMRQEVMAPFSEDGAWYRGYVEKMEGNKCKVRFTDYGNADLVDRDQMRAPTEELLKAPVNAVMCRLKGVRPLQTGVWTTDAKDIMDSLVKDVVVKCKVVDLNKGHLVVDLDSEGSDVGKELIKAAVVRAEKEESPVGSQERAKETAPVKMLRYRPDIQLSIGASEAAYVTNTDSVANFWCQLVRTSGQLEEVMAQLDAYCKSGSGVSGLPVGMACGAKYSVDESWYRAKVTAAYPDSMEVFFVDYGNTEKVPLEDICLLNEGSVDLEPQAIQCELESASKASNQLTEKFVEMTADLEVTLNVYGVQDEAAVVRVVLPDGRDVGEVLGLSPASANIVKRATESVEEPAISRVGLSKEIVSTYPEQSIPADTAAAYVGHVENGVIYIQLVCEEEQLNSITEGIQQLEQNPAVDIGTLKRGDVICARFSEDQSWYRAVVKSVTNDSIGVHFVDYGNCDSISQSDDVRALPAEYVSQQALAYACKLSGVSELSADQEEILVASITDKELNVTFLNNSPVFEVELLDENNKNLVSLLKLGGQESSKTEDSAVEEVVLSPEQSSIVEAADSTQGELGDESHPVDIATVVNTMEELDLETLTIGVRVKVTVSHQNTPGHFYVQLDSQKAALDKLLNAMFILYQEDEILQISDVTQDEVVAALYDEDESWYRARVLECDGDDIHVIFVDYGNTSTVKLASLRRLPADFAKLPVQGVECCLAGVEPVEDVWSEEAINCFNEVIEEKELLLEVLDVTEAGIYSVQLLDMGMSVAETLLQKGMAVDQETSTSLETGMNDLSISSSMEEVLARLYDVKASNKLGCSGYKLRDLSASDLELPDMSVAITSVTTPGDFWCRIQDSTYHYHQDLLQESYSEKQEQMASVAPGDRCVACLDGEYHRAAIISADDDAISVRLVDIGDVRKNVQLKDIFKLKPYLDEYPQLAFRCSLVGIEPFDSDTWSEKSGEVFKSLVLELDGAKELPASAKANVALEENRITLLELTIDRKDVGEALVESGIAIVADIDSSRNESKLTVGASDDFGKFGNVQLQVASEFKGVLVDCDNMDAMVFHTTEGADAVLELTEAIEEYVQDQVGGEDLPEGFESGPCLAKCPDDDLWYRANLTCVKEKEDGDKEYQIFLVDYGSSFAVTRQDLMALPDGMLTPPGQAVICRLDEIEPAEEKWNAECIELLNDYVQDGELIMFVGSYEAGAHHVMLSKVGESCSINKNLVEAGLAVAVLGSQLEMSLLTDDAEMSFQEMSLSKAGSFGDELDSSCYTDGNLSTLSEVNTTGYAEEDISAITDGDVSARTEVDSSCLTDDTPASLNATSEVDESVDDFSASNITANTTASLNSSSEVEESTGGVDSSCLTDDTEGTVSAVEGDMTGTGETDESDPAPQSSDVVQQDIDEELQLSTKLNDEDKHLVELHIVMDIPRPSEVPQTDGLSLDNDLSVDKVDTSVNEDALSTCSESSSSGSYMVKDDESLVKEVYKVRPEKFRHLFEENDLDENSFLHESPTGYTTSELDTSDLRDVDTTGPAEYDVSTDLDHTDHFGNNHEESDGSYAAIKRKYSDEDDSTVKKIKMIEKEEKSLESSTSISNIHLNDDEKSSSALETTGCESDFSFHTCSSFHDIGADIPNVPEDQACNDNIVKTVSQDEENNIYVAVKDAMETIMDNVIAEERQGGDANKNANNSNQNTDAVDMSLPEFTESSKMTIERNRNEVVLSDLASPDNGTSRHSQLPIVINESKMNEEISVAIEAQDKGSTKETLDIGVYENHDHILQNGEIEDTLVSLHERDETSIKDASDNCEVFDQNTINESENSPSFTTEEVFDHRQDMFCFRFVNEYNCKDVSNETSAQCSMPGGQGNEAISATNQVNSDTAIDSTGNIDAKERSVCDVLGSDEFGTAMGMDRSSCQVLNSSTAVGFEAIEPKSLLSTVLRDLKLIHGNARGVSVEESNMESEASNAGESLDCNSETVEDQIPGKECSASTGLSSPIKESLVAKREPIDPTPEDNNTESVVPIQAVFGQNAESVCSQTEVNEVEVCMNIKESENTSVDGNLPVGFDIGVEMSEDISNTDVNLNAGTESCEAKMVQSSSTQTAQNSHINSQSPDQLNTDSRHNIGTDINKLVTINSDSEGLNFIKSDVPNGVSSDGNIDKEEDISLYENPNINIDGTVDAISTGICTECPEEKRADEDIGIFSDGNIDKDADISLYENLNNNSVGTIDVISTGICTGCPEEKRTDEDALTYRYVECEAENFEGKQTEKQHINETNTDADVDDSKTVNEDAEIGQGDRDGTLDVIYQNKTDDTERNSFEIIENVHSDVATEIKFESIPDKNDVEVQQEIQMEGVYDGGCIHFSETLQLTSNGIEEIGACKLDDESKIKITCEKSFDKDTVIDQIETGNLVVNGMTESSDQGFPKAVCMNIDIKRDEIMSCTMELTQDDSNQAENGTVNAGIEDEEMIETVVQNNGEEKHELLEADIEECEANVRIGFTESNQAVMNPSNEGEIFSEDLMNRNSVVSDNSQQSSGNITNNASGEGIISCEIEDDLTKKVQTMEQSELSLDCADNSSETTQIDSCKIDSKPVLVSAISETEECLEDLEKTVENTENNEKMQSQVIGQEQSASCNEEMNAEETGEHDSIKAAILNLESEPCSEDDQNNQVMGMKVTSLDIRSEVIGTVSDDMSDAQEQLTGQTTGTSDKETSDTQTSASTCEMKGDKEQKGASSEQDDDDDDFEDAEDTDVADAGAVVEKDEIRDEEDNTVKDGDAQKADDADKDNTNAKDSSIGSVSEEGKVKDGDVKTKEVSDGQDESDKSDTEIKAVEAIGAGE